MVEIINNGNGTGNNAQIQIFTTESSRDPALGTQLRNKIEELTNEFIELDDKEKIIKRDKKSLILEIADLFERLHEIGEFPLPIDEIGGRIYIYLQRKGFDVTDRYIRKVLSENAPHFLHDSYQDRNSSAIDIKIYQQEVLEAIEKVKNIKYSMLKREQIMDIHSHLTIGLDDVFSYASQNNILVGRGEEVPHYDYEDTDPFKDPIYTDKPDARPSNLAEATVQLGDTIIDFGRTVKANGEMMREYPPEKEDIELEVKAVNRAIEWSEWWRLLTQSLKPGTDRKYRRSMIQWVKIADDEQDWGKHAASSKNPYLARFRDPKTGEVKEEIRKLTREQIGDVSPKVREFALLFKKAVPYCLDMVRWSEFLLNPWTNGLSVKLSDKLSDRSLR